MRVTRWPSSSCGARLRDLGAVRDVSLPFASALGQELSSAGALRLSTRGRWSAVRLLGYGCKDHNKSGGAKALSTRTAEGAGCRLPPALSSFHRRCGDLAAAGSSASTGASGCWPPGCRPRSWSVGQSGLVATLAASRPAALSRAPPHTSPEAFSALAVRRWREDSCGPWWFHGPVCWVGSPVRGLSAADLARLNLARTPAKQTRHGAPQAGAHGLYGDGSARNCSRWSHSVSSLVRPQPLSSRWDTRAKRDWRDGPREDCKQVNALQPKQA